MMIRRWIPYVMSIAIYAGLFAAYRLWLVPLLTDRPWTGAAESREFWRIRGEVMTQNERLRDIAVRDSVARLIPDSAQFFIVVPPGDTMAREYLQRVAMREGVTNPATAVGIVMLPAEYGGHPTLPERMYGLKSVSGEVRGMPYCVMVMPFHRNAETNRVAPFTYSRYGALTGPCHWWARYGAPGTGIANWLTPGGVRFAHNTRASHDWDPGDRETARFGRMQHRTGLTLDGKACVAGQLERCANAVLRMDTAWSVGAFIGNRYFGSGIMDGEGSMLADLEGEFGAERFQEFWRSPNDVERAFQAAFGVPLGEWVRGWVRARAGPGSAVRLGGPTLLLALLFIGICVGIGSAAAQRRRL